jgi:hypothetical protein
VKADVKQAEQQESALGLSMSWVMSGRACWNQFAYLRHIRERWCLIQEPGHSWFENR